jgi:16S rRNA (cytidine1402-2'-O)-methyltransferase
LLTLVPTPIGNLEDISFRAINKIVEADIVFCEDTRVTRRLIHLLKERYNIKPKDKHFISLHSHNETQVIQKLDISIFEKEVIYLSDAGMPSISDPGSRLVAFCQENDIEYDILPGANALLCAYAMSGFEEKEFSFYGFLANKGQKRLNELNRILRSEFNMVLYEAPHRIESLMRDISTIDETRELFLVKEISKLNQKYFKGTALELANRLPNENTKGEWVLVVRAKSGVYSEITTEDILTLDIPKKIKAKLLSKITGKETKLCYDSLINQG